MSSSGPIEESSSIEPPTPPERSSGQENTLRQFVSWSSDFLRHHPEFGVVPLIVVVYLVLKDHISDTSRIGPFIYVCLFVTIIPFILRLLKFFVSLLVDGSFLNFIDAITRVFVVAAFLFGAFALADNYWTDNERLAQEGFSSEVLSAAEEQGFVSNVSRIFWEFWGVPGREPLIQGQKPVESPPAGSTSTIDVSPEASSRSGSENSDQSNPLTVKRNPDPLPVENLSSKERQDKYANCISNEHKTGSIEGIYACVDILN
ncbi:hypothetical protein [Roseibium sp.]|uniref:hypothetical protein n=1 Tax=Roseibium sp. TaxID=1936156 RepID=UPI003A9729DD